MNEQSELQRMLAGEWYCPLDSELANLQADAREILRQLENPGVTVEERERLLKKLLGSFAQGCNVEPQFSCDYGFNIFLGERASLNFGCSLLDCGKISIGARTHLGPGVHIYAVTHPTDAVERRGGPGLRNCKAIDVVIGEDCWIGGRAIILPGVKIGDRCIIGAGSVVTRDVPSDTTVIGNPARSVEPRGQPEDFPPVVGSAKAK